MSELSFYVGGYFLIGIVYSIIKNPFRSGLYGFTDMAGALTNILLWPFIMVTDIWKVW